MQRTKRTGIKRIGKMLLLVLVSLTAAPVAVASDADAAPAIIVTKAFSSKEWRKLDGPDGGYFVCMGEYRTYFGNKRCRVPDSGLSGFMGAMLDEQELPIAEALAKIEGVPIKLQTLEVSGLNLVAKYKMFEAALAVEPVPVTDLGQALRPQGNSLTGEGEGGLAGFNTMSDRIIIKIFGSIFFVFGLADIIVRQRFIIGIMGLVEALFIWSAPSFINVTGNLFFIVGMTAVGYYTFRNTFRNPLLPSSLLPSYMEDMIREIPIACGPATLDELRERQQQANNGGTVMFDPITKQSSVQDNDSRNRNLDASPPPESTPDNDRESEKPQAGKRKIILD